MSAAHHAFLRANAMVQAALCETIPANASVAISDSVLKEIAPVCHVFELAMPTLDTQVPSPGAFTAWLGAPGSHGLDSWLQDRETKTFQIRSWIWNPDLSVAAPRGESLPRGGSNNPT